MSRFSNLDTANKAHISSLWIVIVVQFAVMGGLWYGWQTAPRDLRISVPPDLRDGAIVRPDEYDAATVFAFAMATFRELNRWEENGVEDYGKKIQGLQARLTPTFREYLIRDMNIKHKKGELKDRVRYALEIPGNSLYRPDLVRTLADGSWIVDVNLEIVERVASMEAKRRQINYPLRVVRMNISPEQNMWGLALDGYPQDARPTTIDNSNTQASR